MTVRDIPASYVNPAYRKEAQKEIADRLLADLRIINAHSWFEDETFDAVMDAYEKTLKIGCRHPDCLYDLAKNLIETADENQIVPIIMQLAYFMRPCSGGNQ